MPDLSAIIQASTAHAWLYLPAAVILGALHALEPGHAKSLMAAYIVAVKGTASQAATLGVSAAIGHTIVVWILAIAGLLLGSRYIVEQAEPWLLVLSGVLVILLALRMIWQLRAHLSSHGSGQGHSHDSNAGYGHAHHHHGHSHQHAAAKGPVSTAQIIWFGFTGGLMPCPAAIAVLLVCVQLKAFALGVAMVAAFSVGVGATLVMIGLAVVWSSGKLSKAWPGFERLTQRLPYISAGIVMLLGIVMTAAGLNSAGVLSIRKST